MLKSLARNLAFVAVTTIAFMPLIASAQWYSSVPRFHERNHVKHHVKRDVTVVREKPVVVVPRPRPISRSRESPPPVTSPCPSRLPTSSPPRTWAEMSFEEKWSALICTEKQYHVETPRVHKRPNSYQGN
jgi:hypothetical protein